MNKGHSRQLGMDYVFDGTDLHFQDGVSYTLHEALLLSWHEASAQTIQAVHLIKKHFEGEIFSVVRSETMSRKGSFMEYKDWRDHSCKRCGTGKFTIIDEVPHTGVYCSSCGSWQGWLKKTMKNRLIAMCGHKFTTADLRLEEPHRPPSESETIPQKPQQAVEQLSLDLRFESPYRPQGGAK